MAVLLRGGGHETDTRLTRRSLLISSPVLVGRQTELSQLLAVARNAPGLAIIEGDAGLGKSRLAEELLERPEIRDKRHLVGRCHPLREPFPLGPVVEAIRSAGELTGGPGLSPVVGSLRRLLPEMSEQLPPLPEPTGDPIGDRHVLFQGLLELFEWLGPTVCLLEDLHWGDEGTWEFLHFLVSRLPSQLALIVTYRMEGAFAAAPMPELVSRVRRATTTAHLTLAPLTVGEVHQLVNELLPGQNVSEDFAAQIHERTSGIPFAVEEVARLVQDRRELFHGVAWWVKRSLEELDVPPTIRDSVVGRVATLGADVRRLVDAAAVLGTPTTEDQLARVADLAGSRGAVALASALRAAVLVGIGEGTYGFRHALACQAMYEAIPPPERRRLHLQAAQALQSAQPPPFAQLARHNQEAGRTRQWVRYAEMAADQAWSHRDAEAATHFLNQALAAPRLSGATVTRLAPKLAEFACWCIAPHPETVRNLRRLVDDARLPRVVRGRTRSVLGGVVGDHGDIKSGNHDLERALPELGTDRHQRARVMMNLALGANDVNLSSSMGWLARAAAEAATLGSPRIDLEMGVTRAVLLAGAGHPRAAKLIEALPWGTVGSDGDQTRDDTMMWAAHNIVHASVDVGNYGRARFFHDWSAVRARDNGWGKWAYVHRSQGLLLDWATGEWAGLRDRARHASESHVGSSDEGIAQVVAGLLSLADGYLDTAQQALRTSGPMRTPYKAMALAGLGRIHLARGHSAAAVSDLLDFIDLVMVRRGISAWVGEVLPVAVDALVASDRSVEAESLVRDVERELRGRDAPLANAGLSWTRGVIAANQTRYSVAADAFGRAEREFACLPRPYDSARALERRGLCLVAVIDASAADSLGGALQRFRRLGARADFNRVRRTLRAHSFPVPAAERTPAVQGMALTRQETEVVRRAAVGLTASEISSELSLSQRTVEQYLRFAIRKLGVDRKRDLVGRADLLDTGRRPAAKPK